MSFLKRIPEPLLALLVYSGASLVLFLRPVLGSPKVECICAGGPNPDPTLFMWGMSWWPVSLTHGNPVVSHAVFAPEGANLAHVTTVPGPSLVLAPVTALFGPVVSYNLALAAVPVLSAFFAFLLCRTLTESFWPSFVGGWLFGFSSYELAQMTGHLNLALVFPVPLMVLLVVLRIRGALGQRAFAALAALTVLAQLSISTEVLMTGTLFGALALFVFRDVARPVVRPLALAYAAAALVASPYLWYALSGGGPRDLGAAPTTIDLLNVVTPTQVTRMGGAGLAWLSERFHSGWGEAGGYLGAPLIAIVVLYTVATWRSSGATRRLVLLAGVAWLASLGARLYVAGEGTIPLPWALADDLPLLRSALPVRFFVFATLITAVMAALWLAREHRRPVAAWALATFAVIALMPFTGKAFWYKRLDVPPFFGAGTWQSELRDSDVVLILPHSFTGKAMLWQAWTRIGFDQSAGYFGENWRAPDEDEPLYPIFTDQRRPLPPRAHDLLTDYIRRHRVTAVVVDPIQAGPWPVLLDRGGYQGRLVGGIGLYRTAPRGG